MENVQIKSDPIVTAIFDALATGEKCLCDLKEIVGIPPTWELYDLRVLEEQNAIQSRTANGYRYYSLTPNRALWYLRRSAARAAHVPAPVRRPVQYYSALEYTRRTMPGISEYEAVLRRGC
jgi:hypothetical protein